MICPCGLVIVILQGVWICAGMVREKRLCAGLGDMVIFVVWIFSSIVALDFSATTVAVLDADSSVRGLWTLPV